MTWFNYDLDEHDSLAEQVTLEAFGQTTHHSGGDYDSPFEVEDDTPTWDEFIDEAHGTPYNGEPAVHGEELPDEFAVSPEEAFEGVGTEEHRTRRQRYASYQPAVTPKEDDRLLYEAIREDTLDRRSRGASVNFERQRPTGRMAPADVEPDRSVPTDRDASSGRFVSPERTDAGISRDPRSGAFRERRRY